MTFLLSRFYRLFICFVIVSFTEFIVLKNDFEAYMWLAGNMNLLTKPFMYLMIFINAYAHIYLNLVPALHYLVVSECFLND